MEDVVITTEGTQLINNLFTVSHGILGEHTGTGDVHIETTGGSIETKGAFSYGIYERHGGADSDGDLNVTTTNTDITTHGDVGVGIYGRHVSGTGAMVVRRQRR